ncbi:MAG TPA: DoxX family membrane protein [Caulobacteraceae bacterium]|jgi:uncharacterized membrane protein YphA (DoxX/SURF4 family)
MTTIGRHVYSAGIIGLGVVELTFGSFAEVWIPVSARLPGYPLLVWAIAGVLVVAGLAINWPRTAKVAALALGALFALGMLATELVPALARPAVWGEWQALAESTAMALGGVLAYALSLGVANSASLARIARWAFGACLLVFGVSHFAYAKFTASLVPAWLPPSQMFWAYATGLAQIAAGLAMLSGVQARLAAICLTAMYAIFGLLVHIPSVIAHPASHDDWAENAINLIITGAAWVLADSLADRRLPWERT